MRIICTFNDQKKGHLFSSFLAAEGIENQLEITTNVDWGSPNYSDVTCRIWIYDEDSVPAAMRWLELFEANPDNPIFQKTALNTPLKTVPIDPASTTERLELPPRMAKPAVRPAEKMGPITFYILVICCLLFLLDMMTTPALTLRSLPENIPPAPILTSPVKKAMYYDYPQAYAILDRIVKLYGADKLQTPQDLPSEGQYLLNQFYRTPYWHGLYEYATRELQDPNTELQKAPLFEKIRQGEIWRAFSPSLLHNDILHILFNMLWLILLGKQIEQRLRAPRYIIFILIAGIFSNTCQYLMSGSNFIGFSGILCAMLTFIWMRQRIAPWEGYPLPKATIAFMMFFIFAVFFLQLVSFYLETKQHVSFSPGIANTAHLSGAFIGVILGRLSFFSWKA